LDAGLALARISTLVAGMMLKMLNPHRGDSWVINSSVQGTANVRRIHRAQNSGECLTSRCDPFWSP
jgi:hypothetical protein